MRALQRIALLLTVIFLLSIYLDQNGIPALPFPEEAADTPQSPALIIDGQCLVVQQDGHPYQVFFKVTNRGRAMQQPAQMRAVAYDYYGNEVILYTAPIMLQQNNTFSVSPSHTRTPIMFIAEQGVDIIIDRQVRKTLTCYPSG
jgi:hypothetical protein